MKSKKIIVGQELFLVPVEPITGMRQETEKVKVTKAGLKKITFQKNDENLFECELKKSNNFYIAMLIENWRIVGYLYLNEEDINMERQFNDSTSYEELSKLTTDEKKQVVSLIKLFNKNKKGE